MRRPLLFWERVLLVERGPLLRYGVAVVLALLSLLAAWAFRWLEAPEVASLALATVVLSGIYGGLGPALLDTAITAIGIEFASPEFEPVDYGTSLVRMVLYAAVGYLIANITASLRDAYRTLQEQYKEKELATRARENVLGIVSHDLRGPLSVIKMTIGALKHPSRGGERVADRVAELAIIERSANQMHRIVDDLLDAVRIEKGQFRLICARHELGPIVEDALQSVRWPAEARGIRLRLQLPPAPVELECDRERVIQVVSNLLHNAVKFSSDGGFVDVAVEVRETEAGISVRDYGAGIEDAVKASLFERHWQAARTAHQGTGLGLFIARSIAEAHGGSIEVDSTPGQGAVFVLSLPRARGADRPGPVPSP